MWTDWSDWLEKVMRLELTQDGVPLLDLRVARLQSLA